MNVPDPNGRTQCKTLGVNVRIYSIIDISCRHTDRSAKTYIYSLNRPARCSIRMITEIMELVQESGVE
nr:hypothetical protein CFP56_37216 [Quercus suber]